MAESSNSSSTGTTGAGSSTSTSNSGAAAPGSQSSSNGSFSTGNGNSNAGPGLSFDAGLASNTGAGWSSNSNGNFGGGLNGTTTGFTGFASDNFGQGWGGSYSISPDSEGKHTIKPNAEGKHVVTQKYSKPRSQALYMTVDEVYGKGNQSIVESQGDYEASSNEKSNVETSTFGKQDEISVTPVSVTKDEGLVNNDAIQSVEGLNFQQKDKANQEVMEAKKSRDDAEAEDNANGMRNQLKAVAEKGVEKGAEEDNNDFQVGDRDEEVAAAKARVDQLAQQESKLKFELADIDNELANIEAKATIMEKENQSKETQVQNNKSLAPIGKNIRSIENLLSIIPVGVDALTMVRSAQISLDNLASKIGVDSINLPTNSIEDALQSFQTWSNNFKQGYFDGLEDFSDKSITAYCADIESQYLKGLDALQKYSEESAKTAKELEARKSQLQQHIEGNKSERVAAEEAYNKLFSDRYVGAEKATFIEAEKAYKDIEVKVTEKKAELAKAEEEFEDLDHAWFDVYQPRLNAAKDALDDVIAAATRYNEENGKTGPVYDISHLASVSAHPEDYADAAEVEALLSETPGLQGNKYLSNIKQCVEDVARVSKDFYEVSQKYEEAQQRYDQLTYELADLMGSKEKAEAAYNKAKESKELPAGVKEVPLEEAPTVTEEAPTVETETPTTEAPSYKSIIEAAKNEINNSKDLTDEQKAETNTVLDNVETASDKMNEAANALAKNPNDINAAQKYVEETARYNKALKDAKGDKTLKNTDFNKTFVESVAAANDFMVTKEDGTQQHYAEFAAEMATKSPELAKGLYEAKADRQEQDGHKVLAAINRAKSKMVMTWLGSKFTFADNQVRNQFNQMAKTDIRATYAAYNNVLNDETGKYSEDDKAEASAAINQANSLMVASAALQASTGFFSGIGDSMSDGVYGKTNPKSLNGYQKALNTASNFAKIALGLGVTPGANEAYQNMYYLAADKVNKSILFNKDFDGDGFALCQEYGNNAAVGMIAGAGELATAVALMFNPATSKMGINLAIDAVQTFFDGLYGVQKEVNKSIKYSSEVLSYFDEAKSIAAETGNKEAIGTMDSAIKQIEDFQLKSDEVGNLDNWLEGSGSNTADNGKFNQALSYDEWLKLIEADPVMQEYAKSLNR